MSICSICDQVVTTSQAPIESLFSIYFWVALIAGGGVFLGFLYFVFRFRYIPGKQEPLDAPKAGVIPPLRGSSKMGWILALGLFLIFIPISVATKDTVDFIEKPPAEDSLIINVEGFQYAWSFTYPNGVQTISTLRVPKDKVIVLESTSRDVFHNLWMPQFKLMVDTIPGQTNVVWFKAIKTGSYTAHCNEICGVGHTFMKATIIVQEPEEFQKWYGGGN